MSKNVRTCQHIKVNGERCGSPTLRGEEFCYFHQRLIRGVSVPKESRLHPTAILEDPESIQAALMEVVNALIHNTIDYRRAELILKALHIAVKNCRQMDFDVPEEDIVRKVPEYADPPQPPKPESVAAEPESAELIPKANWRDELKHPRELPPQDYDEFPRSAGPAPAEALQKKSPATLTIEVEAEAERRTRV